MTGTWYPPANVPIEPVEYQPSAGTGGQLLQHPRLMELPERYRHPRHFWIFDLPEMQTQTWLGRLRLDQRMWERRQIEGPVIGRQGQ